MRRALALAALVALAAPASAAADRLHVHGTKILDAHGRQVVLHGVNVAFKRAPYYPNDRGGARTSFNARDAARLRRWGFNAIRLGVTWKGLEPRAGRIDTGYVRHLKALVRLAGRHGLHVLLDMHQDLYAEKFGGNGAPGWAVKDDGIPFQSIGPFPLDYATQAVGRAFTNFYANRDGIRTRFIGAWRTLARAMRREPWLLGYDLLNEPFCETQVAPCGVPPQPAAAGRWLAPLYARLVPALRRADPRHPVFYEDWPTSGFGEPFQVGLAPNPRWPFPDEGLSHHVYCGQPIFTDPCDVQQRDAFANAHRAAVHNRVAPLLTEFGATDDLAVLRSVTAAADAAGEGWQYWQYKTYGDPTTQSSSGPGGADAESLVDVGGRVKAAKLCVLARAYPQRIAGFAAHWSYDPGSRVLRLSYRPVRGADTVVAVPGFLYPRGWRATTTGGRTALRKRPGTLLIRVVGGRQRLRVILRPR